MKEQKIKEKKKTLMFGNPQSDETVKIEDLKIQTLSPRHHYNS
jgi:hypothetical protein